MNTLPFPTLPSFSTLLTWRRLALPALVAGLAVPLAGGPGLAGAANPAASASEALGERVVVPLSDPTKPARLELGLINGSILVEGYDGKEVIVRASVPAAGHRRGHDEDHDHDYEDHDDDDERGARGRSSAGMKRISAPSYGLSIEERRNVVEIGSDSHNQTIDFVVQVPAASTLELSTVNDGEIEVRGVTGRMEISNVNGGITVEGAASPVVAETVNGDLVISWARLDHKEPLAFSTLNGDIDLTLPASFRADVAFKSENGEIYSDFDVALGANPVRREEERSGGSYRVVIEQVVRGTINGGGPELRLESFNGDVYLRKGGG